MEVRVLSCALNVHLLNDTKRNDQEPTGLPLLFCRCNSCRDLTDVTCRSWDGVHHHLLFLHEEDGIFRAKMAIASVLGGSIELGMHSGRYHLNRPTQPVKLDC